MSSPDKRSSMVISRPKQWDAAFDATMLQEDVERLLRVEPFRSMDPDTFPKSSPLNEILLNETRLRQFGEGEIILRQGDYSGSAFLVLAGNAKMVYDLPESELGRTSYKKKTFFAALKQAWANHKLPEVRDVEKYSSRQDLAYRLGSDARKSAAYVQDLGNTVNNYKSEALASGKLFGEVSVLSRTPQAATIIAAERSEMLEIKWQGLRELMKHCKEFRHKVEELYRERSLKAHFRSVPLFAELPEKNLDAIVKHTLFESYGKFDWHVDFKKLANKSSARKIEQEPIIAEEGHYADGVIMIRSGFARVSQQYGEGHRTLNYLIAGDIFGLDMITNGENASDQHTYAYSLRALGYTDVLRVPSAIIKQYVLDNKTKSTANAIEELGKTKWAVDENKNELIDFFVDGRFINGTQTMLINLGRCTGCDDCVSACAKAHDNNPRFIRHGEVHGKYMVANACMHCHDPVCLIGCPTGAIHRNPDKGQVIINDQTCIGCMTCANSCPYNNIRMVNVRGPEGDLLLDEQFNPIVKASKCDLCFDQIVSPSCQKACPHDALRRIDIRNIDKLNDWLQT